MSHKIYGEVTRGLHQSWQRRVANSDNDLLSAAASISEDALQATFNDLALFPTQAQIFEMVQCARECSNKATKSFSGASSSASSGGETPGDEDKVFVPELLSSVETNPGSLSFGEFCVFATELRKYYDANEAVADPSKGANGASDSSSKVEAKIGRSQNLRTQKSSTSSYDVFLGGSCNPTTWRQDSAIPYFKGQGITYYNPQQSNWVPEMIELEHQAKQTSQLLFFVMNDKTRNVVSMIETAYLAGAGRRVIVTITPYPKSSHAHNGPAHSINGEPLSASEERELNAALLTVHDLVEKQGIPVFSDLQVALACASRVLKEHIPIEELGVKDRAQPVKLAHLQIGDKLVRLREAFDTLDTKGAGQISLREIQMAFRIHAHRDLTPKDLRQIAAAHEVGQVTAKRKSHSVQLDTIMIDFDAFCCIVSEFKHRSTTTTMNGNAESEKPERRKRKKATHFLAKASRPFRKVRGWLDSSSSSSTSTSTEVNSSFPTSNASGLANSDSSTSCNNLKQRRGSQVRDLYLGGTIARGCKWREVEAIPTLKKHGLTFFTPLSTASTAANSRRLIPLETAALDNSRVLLFVISGSARSVPSMCEAAYYIGRGATAVLCIQKVSPDHVPEGEESPMTKSALKDYNRGRSYLSDIANREGVPVFEEISEAVECAVQKCKSMES